MLDHEKNPYRFRASISGSGYNVGEVECELHLPLRMAGPIKLILHPQKHVFETLSKIHKFSLRAEIRGFSKQVETIIESEKAYYNKGSTRFFGPEFVPCQIETYLVDLTIYDLIKSPISEEEGILGRFWITPCLPLNPHHSRVNWWTGAIEIETGHRLQIHLIDDIEFTFDFVYRHYDNEQGEHVSFPELVASFKAPQIAQSDEVLARILPRLDEFLLLASFAARERCACIGWELFEPSRSLKHFRRERTIPEAKEDKSSNDFCSIHEIKIDDLWPLIASREGVSLSQIRNKLVHGEPLEDEQYQTLMVATEHLHWIVERMLLGVLKWPAEKSRVHPGLLSRSKIYSSWKGASF